MYHWCIVASYYCYFLLQRFSDICQVRGNLENLANTDEEKQNCTGCRALKKGIRLAASQLQSHKNGINEVLYEMPVSKLPGMNRVVITSYNIAINTVYYNIHCPTSQLATYISVTSSYSYAYSYIATKLYIFI